MIIPFNVFLFPTEYEEVLKKLARQVYETKWMPIGQVDPEQSDGLFTEARFALLIGDGWIAHIEMYHSDEIEDSIKLAEWYKDKVKVVEGYIDDFPLDDFDIEEPMIYCNEERDTCEAEVEATYKRLRMYATIFIDFDKNIPKEVIEIAMRGFALQKTQIVVS